MISCAGSSHATGEARARWLPPRTLPPPPSVEPVLGEWRAEWRVEPPSLRVLLLPSAGPGEPRPAGRGVRVGGDSDLASQIWRLRFGVSDLVAATQRAAQRVGGWQRRLRRRTRLTALPGGRLRDHCGGSGGGGGSFARLAPKAGGLLGLRRGRPRHDGARLRGVHVAEDGLEAQRMLLRRREKACEGVGEGARRRGRRRAKAWEKAREGVAWSRSECSRRSGE